MIPTLSYDKRPPPPGNSLQLKHCASGLKQFLGLSGVVLGLLWTILIRVLKAFSYDTSPPEVALQLKHYALGQMQFLGLSGVVSCELF